MRRLFLAEKKIKENITTEQAERRALNRAINRMAVERLRERPLRGEIGPSSSGGEANHTSDATCR